MQYAFRTGVSQVANEPESLPKRLGIDSNFLSWQDGAAPFFPAMLALPPESLVQTSGLLL